MTQASISRGRRMSTAKCYLDPARKRANLTIETDAMVESLVLEGRRCTGVRYSSRGAKREARAAREVIVAAGTCVIAATAVPALAVVQDLNTVINNLVAYVVSLVAGLAT